MGQQKPKGSAAKILKSLDKKKSSRGPMTLYLHLPNFARFKKVCKAHKQSPSSVLDEFIKNFLEEAGE